MRNIWTIALREFKAYYTSAIGYVVMAAWMLFTGVIFFLVVSSPNAIASMDPLFRNNAILLVFMLPLLTMRLLAGERAGDQGTGTIEILLTSPVSEWELVLGKFVGAMLYLVSMIIGSLVFPIALQVVGDPAVGNVIAGYVGFLLFGGYVLAFGLLMSSLTNSQIVAAITSVVGLLVLWLIRFFSEMPGKWGEFLAWWSMMRHHEDFWRGLITLVDVAWYLSFIFFFLFLAKQVIASSRWR
ncbi:MAG: ABC transporter permease subunit [Armatimonadetes bacterium]|nr:ABC transporter permease subunit [Armatimonadota bacterium]